jgi:hypothetical protein
MAYVVGIVLLLLLLLLLLELRPRVVRSARAGSSAIVDFELLPSGWDLVLGPLCLLVGCIQRG